MYSLSSSNNISNYLFLTTVSTRAAISIIFFPKANFFTIYISMQLDIVR